MFVLPADEPPRPREALERSSVRVVGPVPREPEVLERDVPEPRDVRDRPRVERLVVVAPTSSISRATRARRPPRAAVARRPAACRRGACAHSIRARARGEAGSLRIDARPKHVPPRRPRAGRGATRGVGRRDHGDRHGAPRGVGGRSLRVGEDRVGGSARRPGSPGRRLSARARVGVPAARAAPPARPRVVHRRGAGSRARSRTSRASAAGRRGRHRTRWSGCRRSRSRRGGWCSTS